MARTTKRTILRIFFQKTRKITYHSLKNLPTDCLDKLPEKRRRVLEMSVWESKSYAEIADTLAISLNTVKDHIKKAYAFLRDEIHKEISSSVLFFAFYRRKNRGCK